MEPIRPPLRLSLSLSRRRRRALLPSRPPTATATLKPGLTPASSGSGRHRQAAPRPASLRLARLRQRQRHSCGRRTHYLTVTRIPPPARRVPASRPGCAGAEPAPEGGGGVRRPRGGSVGGGAVRLAQGEREGVKGNAIGFRNCHKRVSKD